MNFKTLFIAGLLCELVGQILLAKGNDFIYAQRPIDFAHWFLLIGVVLIMPQVVSFPNKIFSYIGAPLAIIGVVCTIGMCVLDFVWWSQETQEIRNDFAGHLSKFPSIWKTFITNGPSFLNIGLVILSLNYIKQNMTGVLLIVLATLIIFRVIPLPFRLIIGYLITAFGFAIIFYKKR
ncbi:hypothetical protein MBM09_01600 [Flaviramulus sp. BrNp1-15]|uniref:hypothetical protein n=1 Tax=Flaviramulus sp. BrNp1-15 TaxID=2916754 RepID=UPI001EE8ABF9|nr:hypothetical protein [Flaviramulus sp. BrNp1-15]ULC59683.1 hypothetical protein MBM09_01600 [Flaviramulus sp. BrNp1-15]